MTSVPQQQPQLPLSLQNSIIETIQSKGSKLTIIVGGTGTGKSTLVPQCLLDHIGHPILCTQPRRLAVVAVSTHVAKQRESLLGHEVGYHVGQNRLAKNDTKLLFATAGILLEELKSNGLDAICKYKAVLIDECHERSAESDLCLVIIKSFLMKYPHVDINIILMSATFNQGKYTTYFQDVPGCGFINTITLETANSINSFYKNVQTFYLEDIMQEKIPSSIRIGELKSFERFMKLDPDSELQGGDFGKSLSDEILTVIKCLVSTLHEEEESKSRFLIFAPTYRHLEQIHSELANLTLARGVPVLVDVLHSSIDIEDCLSKMQPAIDSTPHEQYRHILLASAIADSSVTIPGVSCVIDTCRALEVKWDANKEVHIPKTVWASKSICDQRKGRTGRTCAGRVFRLVNQGFFINRMENWDQPQIELASCRDEILAILSSTNKVFSNPVRLLKNCLDPPPVKSVEKAIVYLQQVGACEILNIGKKKKLVPTDLGRLLAALPYTISDGNIIVQGGKCGMLHEALVLVSILSTRPYPILHIFAENDTNEFILRQFYGDVNPRDPKSVAVANFAAYLFWYVNWKMNIRQRLAKCRFQYCTDADRSSANYLHHKYNMYPRNVTNAEHEKYDCSVWDWTNETAESHIRWCKKYYINPTSVRAIDANVEVALKTLHHKDYEPEWLRCQSSTPMWVHQTNVHIDLAHGQNPVFRALYGYQKGEVICEQLMQLQDPVCMASAGSTDSSFDEGAPTRYACIHFLKGHCSFGEQCRNAHSYRAPRPPCRFFLNGGCENPSCLYAHDNKTKPSLIATKTATHSHYEGSLIDWFAERAKTILLFGECDFTFTRALQAMHIFPSISTTNEHSSRTIYCTISNVDATRCHTNADLRKISSHITTCVWNFPYTGQEEDDSIHTSLISGAFMSVAELLEENAENHGSRSKDKEFALALQGDQLSRWSVLQSAQRAGFYLDWWDEFHSHLFPGYSPKRGNGETFPAQNARFYVFKLVGNIINDH